MPPAAPEGETTGLASASALARWSAERFSLLVDAVEEYAIFLLDPQGHVVSWNEGAQRIKGYSADEILGHDYSVFFTEQDVAAGRPQSQLGDARAAGKLHFEGWRVRKDGSLFWADVVMVALHDESGEPLGFVKITRDDTDRRRAAEQAHKLEMLDMRDRIGNELRESIVRRIFAAGLDLQSALRLVTDEALNSRLQSVIDELDDAIKEIRAAIVGLDLPSQH